MENSKIPDREECKRQIQYCEDEMLIIQKKDEKLLDEQEKLEKKLEKMQGRSYFSIAVAAGFSAYLCCYIMYQIVLGEETWYESIRFVILCIMVLLAWGGALAFIRAAHVQGRLGMYMKSGDLFEKPTLAADIDEILKKRQILQGEQEGQRYKRSQWKRRLEVMGDAPWKQYENYINTALSEEEKEWIAESIDEAGRSQKLQQIESRIMELITEKRIIEMKKNGLKNKEKWMWHLLMIEIVMIIIMVGIIFVTYIFPVYVLGYHQILSMVIVPFGTILSLLLLLFIASLIKYNVAYGKDPLSVFIRHMRGKESLSHALNELAREEMKLAEEEKQLQRHKAMLM